MQRGAGKVQGFTLKTVEVRLLGKKKGFLGTQTRVDNTLVESSIRAPNFSSVKHNSSHPLRDEQQGPGGKLLIFVIGSDFLSQQLKVGGAGLASDTPCCSCTAGEMKGSEYPEEGWRTGKLSKVFVKGNTCKQKG